MTITAELADGRKLEFPDGTDPGVIQSTVKKLVSSAQSTPLPEIPKDLKKPEELGFIDRTLNKLPTSGPIAAVGQHFADAAAGASGLMRGGANALFPGAGSRMFPTTGTHNSASRTLGELFDPVAWSIGGGVSKVLPYAPVLGNGMAQGAKAIGQNLLGGAITGGSIGALSENGDAKTGAGIGAIANSVLPPVIGAAARGILSAKNALYPSAGSLMTKAAGDKTDDVINALMAAPKSQIPGVTPTVAEAAIPAGSTEFAALQKRASERVPSIFFGADKANEAGRLSAIQGIGQNKTALDAAISNRSAIADPLYDSARNAGNVVNTSKVLSTIDDLLDKNPGNRALVRELSAIRDGLYEGRTPRVNAQQISSVVDDVKTAIANKDNAFIRGQLTNIKDQIIDAIPGYKVAQKAFANESVPVNRMQVGQELERALTKPLGDGERAGIFANTVREAPRTIKKATGMDRFDDLSQILSPNQNNTVQNVLGSLSNQSTLKNMAGLGMKSLDERISASQLPPTGAFQPTISAARSWINKALGSGVDNALEKLAPIMLKDPQQAALIMRAASPQQRKVIEGIMSKMMTQGAIVSGANSGLLQTGEK